MHASESIEEQLRDFFLGGIEEGGGYKNLDISALLYHRDVNFVFYSYLHRDNRHLDE